MKIERSTFYICEHCNTKWKSKEEAITCEKNCYSKKMSKCEFCLSFRDMGHERLPVPNRRVPKFKQLWIEKYCLEMKFYERFIRYEKRFWYFRKPDYQPNWGNLRFNLRKDYRKGKLGTSCDKFCEA